MKGGGSFVINYGVDNVVKATLDITSTNLAGLPEIPIQSSNSILKFNIQIQYSMFNIQIKYSN